MSLKSIVRELKEMRDGIGSMSRRAGGGSDGRGGHGRAGSRHSWPGLWAEQQQPQRQDQGQEGPQQQQERWANLPPELLLDVIQRVEASEATWPARQQVVACAAVCRSWREVTKELVKTLEECGRITFPISLKQQIESHNHENRTPLETDNGKSVYSGQREVKLLMSKGDVLRILSGGVQQASNQNACDGSIPAKRHVSEFQTRASYDMVQPKKH